MKSLSFHSLGSPPKNLAFTNFPWQQPLISFTHVPWGDIAGASLHTCVMEFTSFIMAESLERQFVRKSPLKEARKPIKLIFIMVHY